MEGGREEGREEGKREERENANGNQSKTFPSSVTWILGLMASTFTWENILLALLCIFKNVSYQCFVIFQCTSLHSHLIENVLYLNPPGTTVSGICFLSSHLSVFIGSV